MPIGNPISLTDNVASKIISVTATASQTSFTVEGGYRINAISVYRNGIRLTTVDDYQANDGSTVVLTTGATEGDELTFQIFDDFRVADAIVSAASTQTLSGNLTITGALGIGEISGGVEVTGIVTATGTNITGVLTATSGAVVTGVVTATSFSGDGSSLTGVGVGIQSGGSVIGSGITTLNFIGTGNTFAVDGTTVDISIAGGGGGGVGTAINYPDSTTSPFAYVDATVTVTQDIVMDTVNAGQGDSYIVVKEPTLIVASGIGVTVGAGKTLVTDLFQLDGL